MGVFIRYSNLFLKYSVRCLTQNANLAPATNQFGTVIRPKIYKLQEVLDQKLLIISLLKNNKPIQDKDWDSILDEFNNLKATNIDSLIFDFCQYFNDINQVFNYVHYLRKKKSELTLNVVGKYFRCLSLMKDEITEDVEKEIYEIYDGIRKKYELLDAFTCESCIFALCLTKRWKESIALLEMLKKTTPVGTKCINTIITAAFKNDDVETGWKYLNEISLKFPISQKTYSAYVEYCIRNFKEEELESNLNKILHFWDEHMLHPPKSVIDTFMAAYDRLNYNGKHVTINKKGSCFNCNLNLRPIEITDEEFNDLANSVLKNLMIGKNVYCSTSPQELKRYMTFVQTMKKYDVVVDGLNVAYCNRDVGEKRASLKNITEVVKIFRDNGKKNILVTGRVHMNWWSPSEMKELRNLADVFLTKNLSEDDPFLLHLSLLSGPQTQFVSRDLMRQHKCRLTDPKLIRLFKVWQMSRQCMVFKTKKVMIVMNPLTYWPYAQKDANGWHLPYLLNESLQPPDLYEVPRNWLCMRKKKSLDLEKIFK